MWLARGWRGLLMIWPAVVYRVRGCRGLVPGRRAGGCAVPGAGGDAIALPGRAQRVSAGKSRAASCGCCVRGWSPLSPRALSASRILTKACIIRRPASLRRSLGVPSNPVCAAIPSTHVARSPRYGAQQREQGGALGLGGLPGNPHAGGVEDAERVEDFGKLPGGPGGLRCEPFRVVLSHFCCSSVSCTAGRTGRVPASRGCCPGLPGQADDGPGSGDQGPRERVASGEGAVA